MMSEHTPVEPGGPVGRPAEASDTVMTMLIAVRQELSSIKQFVAEVRGMLMHQGIQKEWYTTSELAEAMNVSQYTVQERWCNAGRIECQKDPDMGKWRIPGQEYRRLTGGGALRPREK